MRTRTSAVLASVFAASILAATPPLELEELDEVIVSGRPLPAIEDYLAFPRYDNVIISPGGTRVAMAQTERPERQLTVVDFSSARARDIHFFASHSGIEDLRWISDSIVLVQPDVALPGFHVAKGSPGQLLMRNVDLRRMDTLHDDDDVRREPAPAAQIRVSKLIDKTDKGANQTAKGPIRLVSARTDVPHQALIQTIRSDLGGDTDGYGAFHLNVLTREHKRVAISPLQGGQFITGPDQRIALVAGVNAHNEHVVYHLPEPQRADGRDWQLRVASPAGRGYLQPVAWAGKGEEYYALDSRNLPTRAVVIWDAAADTQRLLYRHPAVDMGNAAVDPAGRPWVFSGTDHHPVYWYPDPEHPLAQLHRALVQKLPREHVDVLSATDDMSIAVVRVSSGHRPPIFLVLDIRTARTLDALHTFPKLRGTRLAPVDAIEFRARDGLTIRGYLTTPVDNAGKPRSGLPLVVIAHDGPQGKSSDFRYEYERQLFASRGYAVLQVNHRGSGGRGLAFERAGDGKWGREVQDDFVDAVRWAIRDGVADPERVCFYGSGYGAYSALMTVAREPGMFQCAIGLTGAYNLPLLLGEGKREIPANLQQVLGNDMQDLKARSPVSSAAAIKAKVMLVHESRNEAFPLAQANGMRSALRSAGNAPQWEVIGRDYSGHFWPGARAEVYTKMFRFLDESFGRTGR